MSYTADRPTQKPGTIRYAIEACSRCGGSGHYSYNQRTGTTCFKCLGKGIQRTRAAVTAARKVKAIKAAHSTIKPAADVLPGDIILQDGYRRTVASVSTDINGYLNLELTKDVPGMFGGCRNFSGSPSRPITFNTTLEQKAAILAEALKIRSKGITVLP